MKFTTSVLVFLSCRFAAPGPIFPEDVAGTPSTAPSFSKPAVAGWSPRDILSKPAHAHSGLRNVTPMWGPHDIPSEPAGEGSGQTHDASSKPAGAVLGLHDSSSKPASADLGLHDTISKPSEAHWVPSTHSIRTFPFRWPQPNGPMTWSPQLEWIDHPDNHLFLKTASPGAAEAWDDAVCDVLSATDCRYAKARMFLGPPNGHNYHAEVTDMVPRYKGAHTLIVAPDGSFRRLPLEEDDHEGHSSAYWWRENVDEYEDWEEKERKKERKEEKKKEMKELRKSTSRKKDWLGCSNGTTGCLPLIRPARCEVRGLDSGPRTHGKEHRGVAGHGDVCAHLGKHPVAEVWQGFAP